MQAECCSASPRSRSARVSTSISARVVNPRPLGDGEQAAQGLGDVVVGEGVRAQLSTRAAAIICGRGQSGGEERSVELAAHVDLEAGSHEGLDDPAEALPEQRPFRQAARLRHGHFLEDDHATRLEAGGEAAERGRRVGKVHQDEPADHRVEPGRGPVGVELRGGEAHEAALAGLGAHAAAAVSIASGERSTPSTEPVGPTRRPAISDTSPTPQPTSRTRMPSADTGPDEDVLGEVAIVSALALQPSELVIGIAEGIRTGVALDVVAGLARNEGTAHHGLPFCSRSPLAISAAPENGGRAARVRVEAAGRGHRVRLAPVNWIVV